MKRMLGAATALALVAPLAQAGGLDRSGQGINLIFEPGTVVQGSLTYVDPEITGTLAGTQSGDVGESYILPRASFKFSVGDNWDIGFGYDEPFGAHVKYAEGYALSQCNQTPNIGGGPGSPTFNPGCTPQSGSRLFAEANSHDLVGIARYKFGNGFSAMGGFRIQTVDAKVTVPAALNYSLEADGSTEVGYLIGGAWERPDIAARVALIYNSEITHKLKQSESINTTLGGATDFGNTESEVTTPASVNLDFQTGIAKDTLLFGTIRWAEWSQTSFVPGNYPGGSPRGTLVSYDNDVYTYSLGIGRNVTENLSLAISASHETSESGTVSDLGPTNGFTSLGIGGTYSFESSKLSAGVRYIWLGDATTDNGGDFSGNTGIAAGVQFTYYLN